jgi:hypothetical protein
MVSPSPNCRPLRRRPPTWQRWLLNALHGFDRRIIDDWAGLMNNHLQRLGGATPMQTARYTVDALLYVDRLRSATAVLASHGNPAARHQLADAALDLKSALDGLCEARDQLLKAAGAERVTYD